MTPPPYVKPRPISIKQHAGLDERWLQDRIAEDPSLLGLGDVEVKDRERMQPRAGRLDLLLQDADGARRFEVELQLGKTDESHIIRTLEYWDIERKRYPQYEHTAVIVAEDITSRFLNVISLFNGFIPLVAIQLNAIEVNDSVALVFTKVVDQLTLGPIEDDEDQPATDRAYWENRSAPEPMRAVDAGLGIIRELDPNFDLNYKKHYIGLSHHGQPNNFVVFRPRRKDVRFDIRLPKSAENDESMEQSGLDVINYDRWGRYQIRLKPEELLEQRDVLKQLIEKALDESRRS